MNSEGYKQDQINLVIELFSSNQFQEALDISNILIKDFPNDSLLFNIIGACYAGKGNLKLSIESYQESIIINPKYAQAHFNLGRSFQDLGETDKAVKSYEKAISINPEYAEAHNNLGIIFQSSGKLDAAVKSYEKAVQTKPEYLEAIYSLGILLQDLEKHKEAVQQFKMALAIKPDFFELHNNLGVLMQKLGYLDKAVEHFEKAVAIKSDFFSAFNNLGVANYELGKYDTSLECYQKAIALNPAYIEAHFNLADLFQKIDRLNDAVNCYEEILCLESNNIEANNRLGVVLQKLNQLDNATSLYRKVLSIEPENIDAQYNLAYALQKLNKFNEAIVFYEKVLTIQPDFTDALNNLGISFKELSQPNKAIKFYEKALVLKPDYAEAHINIGNALMDLGKVDLAIEYYQNALNIDQEYAEAHNNLGISLLGLGRVNEALKSYEKAITFKPEYASAHFNLSVLKKYSENDAQITQMQSILSSSSTSPSNKAFLCFALAKVNEDLGNQNGLFKFLNEGNKLRKEELNFSFDEPENQNIIIKNLFNESTSAVKEISYESSIIKPIFIVGMPRSGTSLVEQIISSHDKVYGAGELNTFSQLSNPFLRGNKNTLSENTLLNIRQKYLNYLSNLNVSENIITDKMPSNFRNIGFILKAFPEAKIIHIKRDAMAICWSIYKKYFGVRGNGWAYSQGDIAQFYLLYEDLMRFWNELYPHKIYDVSYESLTTNQEEETRKLLDYCELDWNENCLNFHKNPRAVQTASSIQVRKKMYKGSSDAWKDYQEYLQPLIKTLNK